ncbi:ATP-dependent DNA helicase DDX11 [Drosophila kikkawai]|uniref:DNA 5'-3' helicase n=1 Tax=Drosophila kikkawai TaxID=30033 RepID=A0A6P4J6G4_DROKI|nr:ATP-dependent DNA helicase DDX11 [Drosophila kikkawai]
MAQYTPRQALATPDAQEFGFPHVPYKIQEQLMQELFRVLENGQVGIFESPTGTGKSLTLTCGALTWLERHEALVKSEMLARIVAVERELEMLQKEGERATDWLEAQGKSRLQREELHQLQHLRGLLEQREQQLAEMRERVKSRKKQRSRDCRPKLEEAKEEKPASDSDTDEEHETADSLEEPSEERYRPVQIFFCSRTHSQLAQIVSELRKTPHGKWVRCISLGSRQQLCGNPQVRSLKQVGLMNERCLEMASQKKSQPNPSKRSRLTEGVASSQGRCPLKTQSLVDSLKDLALSEPLDIEELATEGLACGACSYYASRAALDQAQLILLPYQLMLQKSARQQLGINLQGSVLVVDEAHNLLDTLAQLHGAEIKRQQLERARTEILGYKEHFQKRFSTRNLLKINQLIFIVKRLLKILELSKSSRMLRTYELTAEGDFFNIDLHELLEFCARTRFARKVQGHAARMQREPQPSENQPPTARSLILQRLSKEQEEKEKPRQGKRKLEEMQEASAAAEEKEAQGKPQGKLLPEATPSPIRPLLAFLETLTSDAADGRILLDPQSESLKYLLLDPAEQFSEILQQARAIVIAGGTMQPTQELKEQLFASCQDRLIERFYSHVVPQDAVLPFVIPNGPKGAPLRFNFAQRGNPEMLQELSMLLQNLCQVIPGGVVCFLPSYDYLDKIFKHLMESGSLERISRKKCVFREVAGLAADQLLEKYGKAIKESAGALLLSVVGGKLSEGLNFADDLGRAVLVVGLPYPNRQSPELEQRMRHLDEKLGPGSGNEFYENLCMKAVNQCIGRAVRHIRDYACVYLLDERYVGTRIRGKLPEWIARHIVEAAAGKGGFGAVQAQTARFFKGR